MVGVTGFAIGAVKVVASHIANLSPGKAIIFDLAVILILSTILAFLAKILRQPLIPAYILTGLIIGPLALGLVVNMDMIYAFSEIGIAFLLFIAGLEISFKKIKDVGLGRIVIIGILQVGIIFGVTLSSASFFNLTYLQASYIGIILAFSSTMVDIKLLADRRELVTLHGRLIIGILLLQDLIAIGAIIVFTSGGLTINLLVLSFAKLASIIITAILLQKYILNKLFRFAARSKELLFLSSLAVLFFFIIFAYILGLSIVIGAFIAGISLANSPFKTELESRISPLRDFFSILFFVSLGMQIVFSGVGGRFFLFCTLIFVAFIIKPIITLILLRSVGYQPRTSFLTAISLGQLSEFSLIVAFIGYSLGVLDNGLVSSIILATIITMSITPYLINFKNNIYKVMKYPIGFLKFLPAKNEVGYPGKGDKEILLVGSHRMGGAIMEELLTKKEKLLIVDYNPDVISLLKNKKISCIYGDVYSPELLKKINVKKLKLVISTVPEFESNLYLLKKIKQISKRTKVILTGARISETLKLYKEGADYVVAPKIIAGQEMAKIIHSGKFNLKRTRNKHLRYLKNIHRLLY